MTTIVVAQIQQRAATAAQWTTKNPVLLNGEYGFESDTKKQKVGDGVTAWNSLSYHYDPNDSGVGAAIAAHEAASNPHPVYVTQAEADATYAAFGHLHTGVYEPVDSNIQVHLARTDNPHHVTAAQVGADASGTAASAVAAHTSAPGVHAIAGVTGLQTALDSKSATTHNHDAAYAPIAKGVTNGDAHDHNGGDGGQIAYSSLSGLPSLGSAAAQNTTAFEASGAVATHAALTKTHGISEFGATLVDDADASAARATLGLGTAATTASTNYATAAQGVKADNAVSGGNGVNAMVYLTQSAYDAIVTKNSATFYVTG